MVQAVLADFGHVDILINNAGLASRGQSVADTDPAELERVVRTHAFGPHFLSKLVLPSMRTRPRGDIVMISSAATRYHAAFGAPYNMGKAAMEALAFTLAKEERRHGIHVNVVAPGLVETEMGRRLVRGGAGRRGHPQPRRGDALRARLPARRRSPTWCASWSRTRPATSPASASTSTAAAAATLDASSPSRDRRSKRTFREANFPSGFGGRRPASSCAASISQAAVPAPALPLPPVAASATAGGLQVISGRAARRVSPANLAGRVRAAGPARCASAWPR